MVITYLVDMCEVVWVNSFNIRNASVCSYRISRFYMDDFLTTRSTCCQI